MADLIDRQELLKHKGNCYDEEGHLLYAVGTGTILLMPTVDAETVRHGHWINDFSSPLKCSFCGIVSKANEFTLRTDFKFCPYCGARMDAPTQKSVGNALEALDEVEDEE